MRPRRQPAERLAVVAAGVLVAALGLAYWQLQFAAKPPGPPIITRWNADLYTIYVPAYAFAYRSASFLPTWNPHQLAGVPFLASYNGGFLYPPNFLAAVFPVHQAIGYTSALHVALAGVLAFMCARAMALSAMAAALVGVGFMLHGTFLLARIHPSYLAGLAWIPAVFLCAHRVGARPTPARGALLGAALAAQFLTGHAQIVCYGVWTLVLLAILHLARRPARGGYAGRLAGAGGVAALTALLLAAVQLAPTLEVVSGSVRGLGGLTLAQTMPGAPSLARLRDVTLAGGPLVLLAVAALLDRRRSGDVVIATVLIAVTVLIGLGTAAYTHVFYFLPGVRLFRLPQTILHIATMALALLAGIGLDALIAGGTSGARRLALAASPIAGLALAAWMPELWLFFAVGAAAAAVGLLPGRAVRTWGAGLVLALFVAQRWSQPQAPLMLPQHNDPAFFAASPLVQFLREQPAPGRVLVIKDWNRRFPITEKLGSLYGIDVVQDYEPLALDDYHRLLAPFEDTNVDAPLFWGRFLPRPEHRGWSVLDQLAVSHVVVAPGIAWRGEAVPRFRHAYSGSDGVVYENRLARPRAFFAREYRVVADPDAALAAVQARGEGDMGVVVDREPTWSSPTATAAIGEQVLVEEPGTSRMRLRVTTPHPALLVLSDLYWPGWRVRVDAEDRPMLRADFLFRAVAIEAGDHTVEFAYTSWPLRVGGAVSAGTAIGLLAAALAGRRRRIAHPSDPPTAVERDYRNVSGGPV